MQGISMDRASQGDYIPCVIVWLKFSCTEVVLRQFTLSIDWVSIYTFIFSVSGDSLGVAEIFYYLYLGSISTVLGLGRDSGRVFPSGTLTKIPVKDLGC